MKTHKAIGVDGWDSEELHKLTWSMVVDLSTLLQHMWPHGLTPQQMQARTLLFAKCAKPQNMSHGRPITILGYLVRLSSKLVADQWAKLWPPELSGGLPNRSARDLSLQQLLTIEQAKTNSTAWAGWTMDLVKAFNLIPRRVVWFILQLLGVPAHAIQCWFQCFQKVTPCRWCACWP